MAQASKPPAVKLICGMISSYKELFDSAAAELSAVLGEIEFASSIMDFDFTQYYAQEMGSPLFRRFVAFAQPCNPEVLVEAKLATNRIEREFAARMARLSPGAPAAVELARLAGKELPVPAPIRPINLDPGYIEASKLVLASMKNFSHRLYLGRGVYGEVTLMYHKTGWDAFAWTFPDYASGRYHEFLTTVRERLREQTQQELPK